MSPVFCYIFGCRTWARYLLRRHRDLTESVYRRPLVGRHAAVIPALPEENDAGPGYGYIERGDPEPQDRSRELQIIQMESDEQARHSAPSSMKPITFHQEYVQQPEPRQLRDRRNSRSSTASGAAHDEYRGPMMSGAGPGPALRQGSPVPSQSYRTPSHSPVLLREREPYSPKQHPAASGGGPSAHTRSHSRSSQDLRSPYQAHAMPAHNGSDGGRGYGGASQTPPPPVPATFERIMNAYPAPPMASSPSAHEQEYAYANGRRNGGERYAERGER